MTPSLSGPPDPEVRRLLQELVESQQRTDRWMIRLTVVITLLTLAAVLAAVFG